MLTPAISNVREFLGSWRNLLALGTLPLLGAWIYSRVWMVNPAILGDEYLYSMNARKVGPWDPPVAGDFSNYLFNFVYQGTNLCGDAFYACGKILNIVFFLGFIFTVFILALRFLPFWGAYGFMIAAALSPLSVYTSMFLPESMYFFFIGLVLGAVLRAMHAYTWQNWAIAGAALGLASLVKPHAWLSAIAVGVTILVVGLFNRELGVKKTISSTAGLVAGAVVARVVLGLIVAGPKALGFFGQYLGVETVTAAFRQPGPSDNSIQEVAGNPLFGVVDLFLPQLLIHALTISAMMGVSVIGLVVGLINLMKRKELDSSNALALFSFIWLVSMLIEIVTFTGWVTGLGDDHSARVLLRYYEFLFVVVPLAGLAVFYRVRASEPSALIRWGLAAIVAGAITPAFTGFFGSLAIQIADAPTLAGLVVNADVFNAAALIGFAALLTFAFFPQFTKWAMVFLLPVTLVATGWQIQGQYQEFRGNANPADEVGQWLAREFSLDQLADTWILAPSRFEATNVAIWADSHHMEYELFGSGSVIDPSIAPNETRYVVVVGEISLTETAVLLKEGQGFRVYSLETPAS